MTAVKWQARWRDVDPWFDVPDYRTACLYYENGYECRELVAQPFRKHENENENEEQSE